MKYKVHQEQGCVIVHKIGEHSIEAFHFCEGYSAGDVLQEVYELLASANLEVEMVEG